MKRYFELFKMGSNWYGLYVFFPFCFILVVLKIIYFDWLALLFLIPFTLLMICFNITLGINKELIEKLKEKNNG